MFGMLGPRRLLVRRGTEDMGMRRRAARWMRRRRRRRTMGQGVD